jgi:mono/diheme cytochrome c family protein
MECAAVPLAALSTGHKIGLVVAAAVFIGFALASALVIPRRQPGFPGRRVGLFVLVTLLLLAGMMAAVFVFGKEEESEAQEAPAGETTTETTTPRPTGNPTAGRAVFLSAGCGACHTFKAAGASATVGPNLDEALQGKSAEFIRTSIVDPNAEIAKGYPRNVMPQNFGQQLSDKQLADLIAFLQTG